MNFFLDDTTASKTPPKIILPPGVHSAEKPLPSKPPLPMESTAADAASFSKNKKEISTHKDTISYATFTLRELHEAAAYYLSQNMPPDTPVYITTAEERIAPRSKTAMIGIYPGVMSEAGQLRIETRTPVRKEKNGLLAKLFYRFCN